MRARLRFLFFWGFCGGRGLIAMVSEARVPGWKPSVSCCTALRTVPVSTSSFASVAGCVLRAFMIKKPVYCVRFSPVFFRRLGLVGSGQSIQAKDREYLARSTMLQLSAARAGVCVSCGHRWGMSGFIGSRVTAEQTNRHASTDMF